MWRGTAKGVFTVKSAYYMAKNMKAQRLAECSTQETQNAMWGSLWKLHIPNVEKKKIWRACREILPTKANLCKRKVTQENMCPICGLEEETSFHIFWDCPSARDIWGATLKKFQKSYLRGPTFLHVVEEMCQTCDKKELSLFVGLARRIWFRRNDVLHGAPFTHPDILVQQAVTAMTAYAEANVKVQSAHVHNVEPLPKWIFLQQGWVKLNWDAALCPNRGTVGMGAVIRNWQGRVLAVRCLSHDGFLEPMAAEAWARGQALQFGKEMGFTHLILEGDARAIVEAVNSEDTNWSKIGHLVMDIKTLLQGFAQWQIQAVGRAANNVAHTVARLAIREKLSRTWRDAYPECIHEIVITECSTPL